VTAIPAVGLARGVGGITELQGLIDAHRAADSAFCDAIDRDPAFYSNRRSVRAERERLAADAAEAAGIHGAMLLPLPDIRRSQDQGAVSPDYGAGEGPMGRRSEGLA
jgi:hypothetical protein